MRWPQFSLITLAGIIACCAIACCALIYASTMWAASLLTAALVLLMFAVTAAIYRDGRTRAFWLGASVWGWLYLLLFAWLFSGRQVDTFGRSMHPELATRHVARWIYVNVLPKLRTPPTGGAGGAGGFMFGSGVGSDSGMSGTVWQLQMPGGGTQGGGMPGGMGVVPAAPPPAYYPDEETFLRVSDALWLWLFAIIGGAVGRWLHDTRSAPGARAPSKEQT